MLSLSTENKLAEIFLRISHSERQVEESRFYLSNNYDFDPYSAFKALDRLSIGSVSSAEVQSLLDKHHIFCTNEEAYLAVRQYDSNLDGRLSIEEFFQLVLPSTNPGLKNIAISRRGIFTSEVEYLLVRLLQAEILFHRNLEMVKKEIHSKVDFSISEAFRTIDIRGNSYIDRVALTSFLRRHRNVSDEDVDGIFRRVDTDGDELINYQEFVDCVLSTQTIRSASPRLAQTDRSGFERSLMASVRNSSPLRIKSPQRNALSSNSLRLQSASQNSLKIPLAGSTFRNPTFSSSMRSSQGLSPRNSSPLRNSSGKSFGQTSPLRNSQNGFSLKNTSPTRTFGENTAASFSRNNLSQTQASNSFRKSSPLRRPSPGLNQSRFSSMSATSLNRSSRLQTPIEEKELVAWFQEEIKISREVERKKNELALKHDFNLFDAFRMFDKSDLGYINLSDFEDTLSYFAFYAPRDEIYLLFKHFSHLQNSRLQFADFSEVFSPKQEEYARVLRNRSSANLSGPGRMQVFSRDSQSLFLDTLRSLLDAESLAERVRQRLSRMPEFSLHQAFVAVDKDRNGFITIDEFQSILFSHGIFATSKDLQSLMQKYDKNKDGRVSYSEFIDEVTPKSPRRF